MSESRSAPIGPEPVRVLSVPSGIPVCVRFLGPIRGLDTHWKAGGTVPCKGADECPIALHRLGVIWRGYSPVEAWEASKRVWRPYVLEVTEALEERLRGRELRGETWSLHRVEEKGKSAAVAGVYCETIESAELREAFDVEPILRRLFHCGPLRLDTRNPLPPKLLLEALPGKAPNLPEDLRPEVSAETEKEERAKAAELWKKLRARGVPSQNGAPLQ